MRTDLFIFTIALSSLAAFAPAYAQTVATFDAGPSSMNSGQMVSFGWSTQGGNGTSVFRLACPAGVKATGVGASFSCNTDYTTAGSTGGYDATLSNTSGSSQTVTAKVIPFDSSGVRSEANARTASITVATAPNPITSLTGAAIATSGIPYTITWESKGLDGVNLVLPCANPVAVVAASAAGGNFGCGTPVFPDNLGTAGSLTFTFASPPTFDQPVRLTLIPAFVKNTYDATHPATIDVRVVANIVPNPEILTFTAAPMVAVSERSVAFSWTTKNAAGANLVLDCTDGVTATTSESQIYPVACANRVFATALPASGNTALTFKNTSGVIRTTKVTLIPAQTAGVFDATRGKSLFITIYPAGMALPTPSATPPPAAPSPTPPPTITPTPPPASSGKKFVFTRGLQRGANGADVRDLQEFLKRDAAIYPEGLVTGYFGPATERAVQRFQVKYGIASSGSPWTNGFGAVGPRTRAKLNALP